MSEEEVDIDNLEKEEDIKATNYSDYDDIEATTVEKVEEDDEKIDAENLDDTQAYKVLLRVCDLLTNTKMTKALRIVKQVRNHSLTTLQLYAEIVQVRASMEDSEESFASCYGLLESAEQKSLSVYNTTKQVLNQKKEKDLKDHLESIVTLAEINGMMAMMHGRRANRLRAAHKARKSWKYFEEAEKILLLIPQWSFENIVQRDCKIKGDKDGKVSLEQLSVLFGADRHKDLEGDDIRGHYIVSKLFFGSSLFRYGVSMLPPSLQWLVEKFGFPSADREEAIAKLDTISKMPASPRQLLASGVLIATRYFFFDEKELAIKAVNDMISIFPDSIFFRGILAQLMRREGNFDISTESFKIALKFTEEEKLLQATRALKYELGNNLFTVGNFEDALPLYEHYLENTTSPTFKSYCAYKYCYCLLTVYPEKIDQNRNKIIDILKKASTVWVRKEMSYDVWAARLAQQLMKNNLVITEVQRRLDLATGYVDANMFDHANNELDAINNILEEKKNAKKLDYNEYAHYLYLRAKMLRKTDVDAAVEVFSTLLNNQIISKVNVEKWIIPHAEMDFAEILFEQGKFSSSQAIVNNCKRRSGYDFEKQLSFSIKRMERKLKVVVVEG